MLKAQEQLETAEKILEAATKLFAVKQFSAVSIKEIGQAAGTNSALISYYYGGKQQLYAAVLASQAHKLLDVIENIKVEGEGNPLNKLVEYVNALNDLQMEKRSHMQILYKELLSPSGAVTGTVFTETLLKVHTFMVDLIQEAREKQFIRQDLEVRHVATTIEGMIVVFFVTYEPMQVFERQQSQLEPLKLRDVLTGYIKTIAV